MVDIFILEKLKSPKKDKMESAFNIIYSEYSHLVYFVALKIIKDKDLAKEITNETFLKFFENRFNIKASKNIKYYLVSTSKNLSITMLERQKRYVEFNQDIALENKKDNYIDLINQFKDLLDEEELEIIIMHLVYGFSFKEISMQNNKSINVISSKYRRALIKVKKHYKGE